MAEVGGASAVDRDGLRESVRTTLTRLSRTGELPALPATATAALGIARNSEADVGDLCRIIRTDVGLSARIIRVANSAAYARRTPAKTLQEAVLTVGLRKTCDLLVAASARRLFEGASRNAEALWNHALCTAIAAEELARVTRRCDPQLAFLPGLFHDVGRIAFLLSEPLAYDTIHDMVEAGDGSASDLERAWYGFDHGEAGAILAEDWGLPSEQCDAIRWHHRPGQADGGQRVASLLAGADALAYRLGLGTSPAAPDDASLASFGLSGDDQAALMARVQESFSSHNDILK